jgi:hypothetical protein
MYNEQEQTQLSELLCKFEDVFAKSEFDLGKFNTIQHGIDTGTNRPVKQRIRHTPLGFAGEEEAQLKKMLSAGVILPTGIIKLDLGCFGEFSETKPFF